MFSSLFMMFVLSYFRACCLQWWANLRYASLLLYHKLQSLRVSSTNVGMELAYIKGSCSALCVFRGVVITGVPHRSASTMAKPKVSTSLGSKATWARDKNWGMSCSLILLAATLVFMRFSCFSSCLMAAWKVPQPFCQTSLLE